MRFGSVCSGIEAASVAWGVLGWKAAWFSEIEPFPSAVLAHHYPAVPNLGDMATLPDLISFGAVEAPDILCGGTPCQAFSIAGLRRSLDDRRGNLTLTFCEIANAIDDARAQRGEQPAIVFWENVPGVLTTKDNAFGCFLGALAGEDGALEPPGGKWTNAGCVFGPQRAIAWRILDAQYFGVAQRRRRVFVVASAREGFNPAEVLFEFDSLRRDTPPSREARQEVAGTFKACATSGGWSNSVDHAAAGYMRPVTSSVSEERSGVKYAYYSHDYAHDRLTDPSGVNPALTKEARASGNLNIITMAYGQGGAEVAFGRSPTLTCNHEAPILAFQSNESFSSGNNLDVSPTLRVGSNGQGQPPAIAFSCKDYGADAGTISPTLRAMGHGDSHANAGGQVAVCFDTTPVTSASQVRRLTVEECEFLQGFPRGYSAIPWRKKPASECPDGPRYKALGNSWAVPCVRWIGARILSVLPFDEVES